MRCALVLVTGLLLAPVPLPAQTPTDSAATDPLAAFEDQAAADEDAEQLADALYRLLASPLDLNTATADELAQLPALPVALAHRIVRHRQRHGPFPSVDALLGVGGLSAEALAALRPFVTAGPAEAGDAPGSASAPRRMRLEVVQRVARRFATDDAGPGSPVRLLTRVRAEQRRRLALHLTLDQDAGERFGWDAARRAYGYDFVSAALSVRDAGAVRRLVVGDFVVNAGQGLVFWQRPTMGKGAETVRSAERSGAGVAPHGGAEETRFFRGLAATLRLRPTLSVSVFASRRHLDATRVDTADGAPPVFASPLPATGLHRTTTERARRAMLRHDLIGGDVAFARGGLRLGATGYAARFGGTLRPGPGPERRYAFAGDRAAMGSVYFDGVAGAYHAFGEVALDADGTAAAAGGVVLAGPRDLEVVVHARHFPAAFVSLHGQAFGEYSGVQNETGLYAGLHYRPARAWRVSAFLDQYRSPWVRTNVPRPARGHEALLRVEHQPRRWLSAHVLARAETREDGITALSPDGRLLDAVGPEHRRSVRLHGDYAFSPRLRLRARVEAVHAETADGQHATGLLLYQDVRWQPAAAVRVDARLAFFDTDGFAGRVYMYEDDVRYSFTAPVYSGRGQHAYVLVHLRPAARLLLQARYGVTRHEAGPARDANDTPRRTPTLNLQALWTL